MKISLMKIALFCVFISLGFCSNPIQKKIKELQKCKATLKYTKITQARMLLFPPVPKIYFKAGINVENNNDVEVSIDKFDFTIYLNNQEENKKFPLASVVSPDNHKIPPHSTETIEIDMETLFEKRKFYPV